MCQEYQPHLALTDDSCFRANGYAVVLFIITMVEILLPLVWGYGNINFVIMSSKQRDENSNLG